MRAMDSHSHLAADRPAHAVRYYIAAGGPIALVYVLRVSG